MPPTRHQLLASAQGLCGDFASKKDLEVILSHFSSTHQVTAIEHGESCLAPFLGRPFVGLLAVRNYFELISELLVYDDMKFTEYLVDSDVRKVAVKGRARFTWVKTCESWDETFCYVLDFDEESKITDYQVWADSGAAYLARIGKLEETKVSFIRKNDAVSERRIQESSFDDRSL
jgi:hypothetical protein